MPRSLTSTSGAARSAAARASAAEATTSAEAPKLSRAAWTISRASGPSSATSPRSPAGAVARRRDAAAVQLDDGAHDRQAEAEAAVVARTGGVRLAEAVEDVGQE